MTNIRVFTADWHKDSADIRRIRETIFIKEQGVTPEQEWDSDDSGATHFLACEGEYAIGTARLLPNGCIGRVAVLRDWRGQGIGQLLMQAAIAEAERQGMNKQTLTAQAHAAGFYQRLGFEIISEEFIEAGIPHIEMQRRSPV